MIDHVAIPVRDLATSRSFYEPLFEGLGAKVVMEWPGGVLFGTDDGMVALRESDRVAPLHVAFKADRPGVALVLRDGARRRRLRQRPAGHSRGVPRKLLLRLRDRPERAQRRGGLPPTGVT